MINFKTFDLNEATNLTASELEKPNSTTKKSRIGILIGLIKADTPLEMVKGKPFLVTDKEVVLGRIDQFKKDGKNFALGLRDDKPIMNQHLKKGKVFGGGTSGAGGGTLQTAIAESAQCLWNAALLNEGHTNPIEHFTDDILRKYTSDISVGKTTLKQILDIDDSWKASSYLSAQYLIKNGYINKNHVFHRDSKQMTAIYAAKTLAFKNNDLGKYNNDKWNPGDIWAIDKTFKVNSLDTTTVKQLNRSIMDAFHARTCVGISLKKLVKKAKGKEFNVKLPPDVADFKVVKTELSSSRGTFWSAKSGTVTYDEGRIAIMANSSMGTNKMEILGKGARGGSIGWGVIIDSAKMVFGRKMRTHKQIIGLAKKITKKKDPRARNMLFKAINDTSIHMSREEFDANIDTKDAPWIASKLGAILVCRILELNKGPKANRFITKVVNYAGSKSEDASAYLKVYE